MTSRFSLPLGASKSIARKYPMSRTSLRKNSTPSIAVAGAGFTLVEIVISLGIVSFAIVALVGLLAVSMGSSRDSAEDTAIATMARQVTAEIRSEKFNNLSMSKDYYFDGDARFLTNDIGNADTQTKARAVYLCKMTLTADTKFSTNVVNLYNAKLVFSSALKANGPAVSTISTAIARYE